MTGGPPRPHALRPGAPEDLAAIAALQIQSWQTAYRGLVPDSFLDRDVPGNLRDRWSRWPGEDWRIETAWNSHRLTGFASVDLAHHGGPYVDNLHVAPEAHGQGIGRALMARAAAHALAASTLWLTVIDANHKARRFYADIGGVEGPPQVEDMLGAPVTALPVRWQGEALRTLSAAA